jgi:hypothetical protein
MKKNNREDNEFTNFLEIRVIGLMRSGNHAIIDWIQQQYAGHSICFLNNVKHGEIDPYTNYTNISLTGIDEEIDIEALRKLKKHLLIYSYEDTKQFMFKGVDILSSIHPQGLYDKQKAYIGDSHHKFDILIIRDPFNNFASRIQLMETRYKGIDAVDMQEVVHNWKILARRAITLYNHPKPNEIVINYNRWVDDQEYRKELSKLLLGKFTDESMSRISNYGGGSSFSEKGIKKLTLKNIISQRHKLFSIRRYARFGFYLRRLILNEDKLNKPKLNKAKLVKRWKQFTGKEMYRSIFLDEEILLLSEKLFGEIKDTRKFVESINN